MIPCKAIKSIKAEVSKKFCQMAHPQNQMAEEKKAWGRERLRMESVTERKQGMKNWVVLGFPCCSASSRGRRVRTNRGRANKPTRKR